MSLSHDYNLPIMCLHQSDWGMDPVWPNAVCYPMREVQENCDTLGVFARATSGLWHNEGGKPVYLVPGMSVVGEYKETRSDLVADEHKPCRRRDVMAMGDFRFVWIRRDGELRPEMVPDDGPHEGWGVIVFDDVTWEIARPARRCRNVARWETANVLNKHLRQQAAQQRSQVMQAAAGQVERSIKGPTPAPGMSANQRYQNKHTTAAESYVAGGPCRTAELLRHLEGETGWVGSPRKLAEHLRRTSNKLQAPEPGGNWTICNGGAS